jgi:FMN phosphatase YigB (HAD superfamily)
MKPSTLKNPKGLSNPLSADRRAPSGFGKLVVFDCDQTITNCYLSPAILDNHFIMSPLFSDPKNIATLRTLKRLSEAKFIIVSFGFRQLIGEMLERFDITDLFDECITPHTFNYPDGVDHSDVFAGKTKILNYLELKYDIRCRSDVMFLDDNRYNIEKAKDSGYHCYLSPSHGLPAKSLDSISEFLN